MASNPSGSPLGLRLVPPHERFRDVQTHLSERPAAMFNSVLVLRDAKYLLLESQRTDGTWAGTPMWFAAVNNTIFLRTQADSPTLRRMSRRPIVKVAPCTMRGKPLADYIECAAQIVPREREAQAQAALRRGYGLLRQAFNGFVRNDHVYLELTPIDLKGDPYEKMRPCRPTTTRPVGPGHNPTMRRPLPREPRGRNWASAHDERAVSRGAAFDPRYSCEAPDELMIRGEHARTLAIDCLTRRRDRRLEVETLERLEDQPRPARRGSVAWPEPQLPDALRALADFLAGNE